MFCIVSMHFSFSLIFFFKNHTRCSPLIIQVVSCSGRDLELRALPQETRMDTRNPARRSARSKGEYFFFFCKRRFFPRELSRESSQTEQSPPQSPHTHPGVCVHHDLTRDTPNRNQAANGQNRSKPNENGRPGKERARLRPFVGHRRYRSRPMRVTRASSARGNAAGVSAKETSIPIGRFDQAGMGRLWRRVAGNVVPC